MKTFSEYIIKNGVLEKTEHKFKVCPICLQKVIPVKEDTCLLCFDKKHKNYEDAKQLVKNKQTLGFWYSGWYLPNGLHSSGGYTKDLYEKILPDGYTIKEQMAWILLFANVLNCGSLNKNSKTGEVFLTDYFPEFWVKKFYPGYLDKTAVEVLPYAT